MRPRDNPFRSELTDALPYRLQGIAWDELLERLSRLDYRAAIVGPHGSGKTTLLEELGRRLEYRGMPTLYLRVDDRCPRSVVAALKAVDGQVVLLDGADVLDWLAWALVRMRARRARGLVITSHRPGRLPTLLECSTSPSLLRELLRQLVPRRASQLAPLAEELFETSNGNLRSVFRAFYHMFAEDVLTLPEPQLEAQGWRR